jgi:hypothetical protein
VALGGKKEQKSAPISPGTHLALTHPTPLYQHRLANTGEYKMSEVGHKIELTGGACLNTTLHCPTDPIASVSLVDATY